LRHGARFFIKNALPHVDAPAVPSSVETCRRWPFMTTASDVEEQLIGDPSPPADAPVSDWLGASAPCLGLLPNWQGAFSAPP
jgi:hypothetical protein